MKLSIDCWTKLQKWYLGKTRCYCKNILNVTCVISCNPVCNIFVLFFFMVQFFTMHETLHTYLFWVFGEKTPSLLFMLREEKFLCITTMSIVLRWRISKLRENILRSYTPKMKIVSPCDLTRFSLFQSILPKINIVSPSCAICNMMYDAYAMQNDVMMLCYVDDICSERYTHIPTQYFCISADSSL